MGTRVVLSGHFCVSPHVGHARRKQAGIKGQEYFPEAKIKTKYKTNNVKVWLKNLTLSQLEFNVACIVCLQNKKITA